MSCNNFWYKARFKSFNNFKEAPFKNAIFGETLEDVMIHQEQNFPGLPIPRVLPFLTEAIISLGGCNTEGIFRVPGDGERVNG